MNSLLIQPHVNAGAPRPVSAPLSRVDVAVPCHRYGHFLRQCVQSVLEQTGVAVRVLIIDDYSPDDTPTIGRELAARDSRVEFRRHAFNHGHVATYNEGIGWFDSDYGLLLSADDVLLPGSLERAAVFMESHPKVGFVHAAAIKTESPGIADLTAPAVEPDRVIPGMEFLREACVSGENTIFTPTAVVRNSVQKRIGAYRRELPHAGDFEMWLRFAANSDVGYIGTPQAYYRVHGGNMSSTYPGPLDFEQRKAAFDSIFTIWGSAMENAAELHAIAIRSLAVSAFWAGAHLFEANDLAQCQRYHRLALRMDPGVARTGAWLRFRLKKLLGPAGVRGLRPLLDRLHGKHPISEKTQPSDTASAASLSDQPLANIRE